MGHYTQAFVGIDVAKSRNAIAIAEGERGGEVRFVGEVDASDDSMRRTIKRISAKYDRVHFCYEAGPTGYGLHRLITALGFDCIVVAPSLVPKKRQAITSRTIVVMRLAWRGYCGPENSLPFGCRMKHMRQCVISYEPGWPR